MKSVLMSVRHQHILDMHSGKKTSELRTNPPKIPTPFKVYNFDTISSGGCGKVVSEWVCTDIKQWLMYMGIPAHLSKFACVSNEHIRQYCNNGEKNIAEMKISDLVIYDKPRELIEFKKAGFMTEEQWLFNLYPNTHCHYEAWSKRFDIHRAPQSWMFVEVDDVL